MNCGQRLCPDRQDLPPPGPFFPLPSPPTHPMNMRIHTCDEGHEPFPGQGSQGGQRLCPDRQAAAAAWTIFIPTLTTHPPTQGTCAYKFAMRGTSGVVTLFPKLPSLYCIHHAATISGVSAVFDFAEQGSQFPVVTLAKFAAADQSLGRGSFRITSPYPALLSFCRQHVTTVDVRAVLDIAGQSLQRGHFLFPDRQDLPRLERVPPPPPQATHPHTLPISHALTPRDKNCKGISGVGFCRTRLPRKPASTSRLARSTAAWTRRTRPSCTSPPPWT
jgi:hypothetical protein